MFQLKKSIWGRHTLRFLINRKTWINGEGGPTLPVYSSKNDNQIVYKIWISRSVGGIFLLDIISRYSFHFCHRTKYREKTPLCFFSPTTAAVEIAVRHVQTPRPHLWQMQPYQCHRLQQFTYQKPPSPLWGLLQAWILRICQKLSMYNHSYTLLFVYK